MTIANAAKVNGSVNPALEDLPEGWAVTRLPEICEINPPRPPKDALPADSTVTFVPMPAVDAKEGAITTPETRTFSEVRSGYTSFRDGDVIMAKITPCMENGKAAIARGLHNGMGFGSTEFHVLRPTDAVIPGFVYHFIRQESFRRAAEAEMTGSVGQKRVPLRFLEAVEIPLPPVAEQRQIVAKVEDLLTRVSAGRERLRRVPAILKRFRQAVLAAACSGRLTADWREEHPDVEPATDYLNRILDERRLTGHSTPGKARYLGTLTSGTAEREGLPECWTWASLSMLATYVGDVDHRMPKAVDSGIPYVSTRDFVDDDAIDFEGAKKISEADFAMLAAKIRPGFGDILLSRYGTVGQVRLVRDRRAFQASYSIAIIKAIKSGGLHHYTYWALRSEVVQSQMLRSIQASAQPDLGLDYIRRLAIPLPPEDEQREIVRRVGALLELADTIERRVAAATARADRLTQSILAKAFRGELVSTEAALARREGRDYEPASTLLERIQRERGAAVDGRKRKR